MLALNVYLAMCYHKLDYYDVSQEVLAGYVQQHSDSAVAINLKACNYYKLYNGKAAEVRASCVCYLTHKINYGNSRLMVKAIPTTVIRIN